jgi:hypothetical protein
MTSTTPRHLVRTFKNSIVLNELLNAFDSAFDQINNEIQEAINMLNIDNCSNEWLDNLGFLLGIARPIETYYPEGFLKTDLLQYPVDVGRHYVSGVSETSQKINIIDDRFRLLIRAQIFINNTKSYSINDLEKIALWILSNEKVTIFWCEYDTDFGTLRVHLNDEVSNEAVYFLSSYTVDKFGRKRFYFPWPAHISNINIQIDS